MIANIDVAEARDGVVTPIDYKRGKRPHVARGAYEPERVQALSDRFRGLCAPASSRLSVLPLKFA